MLSISLRPIDPWGAGISTLPAGSLSSARRGDPGRHATVCELSRWQKPSPAWLFRTCRSILAVYGQFQGMDILAYLALEVDQDSLQLSQAAHDQRAGRR